MTSRPIIDVAAALVFHHGHLLITQRYPGAHLGGLWEFPGGKREPQETFEQCLVRELQEELNIVISVGELVEGLTHAYPEKTVRLKFYRCAWQAGQLRAAGCAAFRWVSAAELNDYSFPAADARLLQKLQASPRLWQSDTAKGPQR